MVTKCFLQIARLWDMGTLVVLKETIEILGDAVKDGRDQDIEDRSVALQLRPEDERVP